MKVFAIITGDIINSRFVKPDSRKKLYEEVQEFLKKLKEEKWLRKVEQSGGDSFQCEVVKIQNSLRVALMIKCFVKAKTSFSLSGINNKNNNLRDISIRLAGVRLSIGISTADFIKRKLGESDGDAFLLSGEGLELIKKGYSELSLKTNNQSLNNEIQSIVLLLDALIQKYFGRQAEVILQKLLDKKEEEIANTLSISQSAVNQSARSGKWYAVETAIKDVESKLSSVYE
jgi:hypothetical protein